MTDNPDLDRLLHVARAGSPDALGVLLENWRAYLHLVARQELPAKLQGKVDSSDLVQETFLEANRDFPRFAGSTQEELGAWLRQLLLNNLANWVRRFVHTDKRAVEREAPMPLGSAGTPVAELAANGETPSRKAMAREDAEAVRQALERLPEEYRQILVLRYQEQLPFEEVARRMQRTANAVRKLWARAVDRLRQEMPTPP